MQFLWKPTKPTNPKQKEKTIYKSAPTIAHLFYHSSQADCRWALSQYGYILCYPIIHPLKQHDLFSICRYLRQRQLISPLCTDNRALKKKSFHSNYWTFKAFLVIWRWTKTFGSLKWESTWTTKQASHWCAQVRELADYGIPLPCVRFGVSSSFWPCSMVLEVFLHPNICAVPMGPVHHIYSLSHRKKSLEKHYKNYLVGTNLHSALF